MKKVKLPKWLYSIFVFIVGFFKHDCQIHRKCISESYLKDGDSGVIFSMGKDYECTKCGKKWNR
jgi:hypothetical protein